MRVSVNNISLDPTVLPAYRLGMPMHPFGIVSGEFRKGALMKS